MPSRTAQLATRGASPAWIALSAIGVPLIAASLAIGG